MEKTNPKMEGNFPVDQFMIDEFDPNTGVLLFTKRISRQDRFLNSAGQEISDPRPMSPSLGAKPEMHIRDYIKTLVHSERLLQEASAAGFESFEEANDFEVGDDYFPDSQYENDLEPSIAELVREGTASLSAKARAQEKQDRLKRDAARHPSQASDEVDDAPQGIKKRRSKSPPQEPSEGVQGDEDPLS